MHFSRFMVEGDEKLLFILDIDGEVISILSGSWRVPARCLMPSSSTWTTLRPRPWLITLKRVIKWLKRHVREPLDAYFAYEDASVQDIKECARAAGFTGNTSQGTLLTYMTFKSRVQGFASKLLAPALVGEKGHDASDSIGTLHFFGWVAFEKNRLGFFTIFDGDFAKYIQDFAEKTSFAFDAIFPRVIGGPPTPVAKNAQAFYQWALENNYPAIGFYSAYPGLGVQDILALLADYRELPADTAG